MSAGRDGRGAGGGGLHDGDASRVTANNKDDGAEQPFDRLMPHPIVRGAKAILEADDSDILCSPNR